MAVARSDGAGGGPQRGALIIPWFAGGCMPIVQAHPEGHETPCDGIRSARPSAPISWPQIFLIVILARKSMSMFAFLHWVARGLTALIEWRGKVENGSFGFLKQVALSLTRRVWRDRAANPDAVGNANSQ